MIKYIYNQLPISLKGKVWIAYNKIDAILPFSLDKKFKTGVYQDCFKETKVIFIHIPKAAGTSVANWLYGKKVGHLKLSDFEKVYGSILDSYKVVTFVRDPAERLYSAFCFLKQGGGEIVSVDEKISKQLASITFEQFVLKLYEMPELKKLDVTLQDQVSFLRCKSKKIDFLGKIESFEQDCENLGILLSKSSHISSLNVTNKKKDLILTPRLKDIIKELYIEDYKAFYNENL